MYTFWVVVIGFSMFVLIVIYTYQFDNFDKFLAEFMRIDIDL